jgi:hypothetical protein
MRKIKYRTIIASGAVFFKAYQALNIPLLVIVLFLTGCQTTPKKQNTAAEEFNQQSGAIYNAYLEADTIHAGQDLLDLAQLAETERGIPPKFQAAYLTRAYSWLFVFEQRTGNEQLAEVYFEKARDWRIRKAGLDGDTDSQMIALVGTFTKEKIISEVDKQDKGASNGKGPYYLQQLKPK